MTDEQGKMDILPMDVLDEAAACLKIMAHPVRLKIVDILMQGDLAVHEISEMCGVKPHQICEHLRLMQTSGLLASRRIGRTVHYSIVSPRLVGLIHCIRQSCGSER